MLDTHAKHSYFQASRTPQMQACLECLTACHTCAQLCLEHNQTTLAALCLDCAEICELAIKFESRRSKWAAPMWDLCAQACQECADECERVDKPYCKECCQICRRCQELSTIAGEET